MSTGRMPMNLRVAVAMSLAVLVPLGTLARTASAQSTVQPPAPGTPVGTWRGESACLVRPSACNDEIVVYRITPMKAADSLAIDARKLVRGEEQEMGVLRCRAARLSGQITCTLPQGAWHFSVRNDSLTGELRLLDNTRYREVRTKRAP